jgi:hypothetical protein
MRAILSHSDRDLDDAPDGFGKNDIMTWTDEERRNKLQLLVPIYNLFDLFTLILISLSYSKNL